MSKELIERVGYDPYDMSVKVTYPYSYYSIDKDKFFPKYKSGTPMNRGELVFLESTGLYTFRDNEYIVCNGSGDPDAYVVMEEEYAISSGFKENIDKYKDDPLDEKQLQELAEEEIPEDQRQFYSYDACIERYKSYLDIKLKQQT